MEKNKYEKEALQVSKEIVVKFVEAGRVTPSNFAEVFPAVYGVVLDTISPTGGGEADGQGADLPEGSFTLAAMKSPFKK